MSIRLGLGRILRLSQTLGNPASFYKTIHISGTNGKGSVVSYISSILSRNGVKTGKFTSPHLIDRFDCIYVNDKPVSQELFEGIERSVLDLDNKYNIGATQFELLTTIAFEVFRQQKVEFAVIETGLGGRDDSTNIVSSFDGVSGVVATGITKIGLDHEGILGNTLKEIASQKAGIIKENIPCVVDSTNDRECIEVIREETARKDSSLDLVDSQTLCFGETISSYLEYSPLKGAYQVANLAVALKIVEIIRPQLSIKLTKEMIIEGIKTTTWPGRLQHIDIKYSADRPSVPVILDGAHNESASIELAKYLESIRNGGDITFIVGMTKGKNATSLLKNIVKSTDELILTRFGSVDGMPWIESYEPQELVDIVVANDLCEKVISTESIKEALEMVGDNIVVICGSLYLVGELLRIHRDHTL